MDPKNINNIGLGDKVVNIVNQIKERFYHYDKRKENKIVVGEIPPLAKHTEKYDLWIDTSSQPDMWNVQFIQLDNQTIYCTDFFGNKHSEDFVLKDGTPFTVEVVADENYIAGTPNIERGEIHSDIILFSTEAISSEQWIHIVQSEHQTIIVTVNNSSYTADTKFPIDSYWEASIIADKGYTPGELNISNGLLKEDTIISATNAEIKMYQIHISKYENQAITVIADGNRYIDDISLPYGTQWSAEISANEGYTAGTLNAISGVLDSDISISATPENIKTYWIRIPKYDNQTIIVTANEKEYLDDICLPYGTIWDARIEANEGYIAGKLDIERGTLTSDIILSATESSQIFYTIYIPKYDNQKIKVIANEEEYTENVLLPYGTAWSAVVEPMDGEEQAILNTYGGILTSDVNISIQN